MMRAELKNKIWLVISATFAFAALFAWYGSTKPVFYESKTVLTLLQPPISGRVTPDLNEEGLEQRIFSLNQEILSRTSLEPMIGKYRLFEKEKAKGMPMELLVEKMQKNIRIEPQKERIEVVGFSITYRDSNPEKARNVAAELASKYVNAQVSGSVTYCTATKTKEFIETERHQAEQELRKLEIERLKIFVKKIKDSIGKSFETECFSAIKIEMLYNQKWTASQDKKSLIGKKEIANVEHRLRANDKQLSDFTKEISKTEAELLKQYPELKLELAEIDVKYQTAKSRFEDLTKKANEFCNDCDWETPPNGISIQIVDPANLPTSPKSFTTKDFALIGAGFGFIFSLFLLGLGSGVNYLNNKFGKVVLQ